MHLCALLNKLNNLTKVNFGENLLISSHSPNQTAKQIHINIYGEMIRAEGKKKTAL